MVDSSREMLTIKEAAVELDRSVGQVRRYVRDGKLPAKKIGMQWFIAPDELTTFKASRNGLGRRMATWIESTIELREEIRASHGTSSSEGSAETIRRLREERDNEIMGAAAASVRFP